ncbi:DNA-formamidopyrimidine glycosylase family protein [Bogoriella caseilytica]|uniref:DNA-(apurinic or apyrimidinic site) lyase n=1 Tax=Bogoriella caseilytica TaxID=56055 RepID=A0A3N2BFM0_9MICO|nr:DNA-formamidopyrimidine glycosylase family protein [Bogoriella caseilytica]ROR74047.1 endonuclease-8 [Bogoriella caseilytica]
MPEGDIVLRVARRLDQALAGQRLSRGELRWPSVGGYDLRGRVITGHATHGKNLLARLDDGRTLHTHLRMDGVWRIIATSELTSAGRGSGRRADRSPRVRAVLATPAWTALGIELGMVNLVATRDEHQVIGHLGPDVLAPDFDAPASAVRLVDQGQRPVCEALLDQRVIAGFGTIYCAETLWHHRVWPWLACGDLDAETATALLSAGRQLMWRSAMARTPTATGEEGPRSNVHSRLNRPCRRCGQLIARGVAQAGDPDAGIGEPGSGLGTRPIFWCPGCQRQS